MATIEIRTGWRATASGGIAAGLALAALLLAASGCGGSSSPAPAPITAEFRPNSTQVAPDLVRLTGSAAGDTVIINVMLGGETTSDDLYSFAFDLIIGNSAVMRYINGSATFGEALTIDAGQQSQVLATQSGNRVTIGVSKLGGGAGNGVTTNEESIVSLGFRVLRRNELTTISITGSPPNDPAALDSTGQIIGSIDFDDTAVGIIGS
jgi:hypothetical protein